ncbi:PREDICTED: C-C motif chemokine 21-like [Nanorana parkeri]|uniref:C-C motif chemokine 21-like n=1 Tax=Nanorana parkeri TaxID=125878 RepID=UPI0008549953|nr:PREDICTED: C-C motif chemokine 21-like [Nanorana parkeri]
MRGSRTLLLLTALLYSVTYTQGTANTVADCCLQTGSKRIPSNIVAGYELQTPEKGCMKTAVVFLTNTKPLRRLCAPQGSPWVVKLMKRVDKKKDLEKKDKTDRRPKKTPQRQQRE